MDERGTIFGGWTSEDYTKKNSICSKLLALAELVDYIMLKKIDK